MCHQEKYQCKLLTIQNQKLYMHNFSTMLTPISTNFNQTSKKSLTSDLFLNDADKFEQ